MNPELKKRINNISDKGLDSVLIENFRMPNPNFFYFTNSNIKGIFFHDINTNKSKIITTDMEYEKAKKSWVKNIVKIEKYDDIFAHITGKNIGIEKEHINSSSFEKIRRGIKKQNKKAKITDISKILENSRAIKTQYEIEQITKACKISRKVYEKAFSEINKKITELELKAIIEFNMSKFGVSPSFSTIVATGNNIRTPHHEPSRAKLKKPILIDFGVCYKGYNSDISRTIGSRYENIINNIFEEMERKIEPGVKTKKIDYLSRELLGKNAKHFITGLGHGIGIEVHEKPDITKNSRDVFAEGMTFAIEPGIYVNNGIRIENNYLLTDKGLKSLTDFC